MNIEQKKEQKDNMGAAGRVETGAPKVEQDRDLKGNQSNSGTRETAREKQRTDKNLTPEQKQQLENQTQCLRGDAYRKASAEGAKGPAVAAGGEKGRAPESTLEPKKAELPQTGTRIEHQVERAQESKNSDVMNAFSNKLMLKDS
jgi:hypothetical protein